MPKDYEIIENEKFYEKHPNLFLGACGAASLIGMVAIGAGIYWVFGKVIGKEVGKEIRKA